MKGDDLAVRLLDFGVGTVRLCARLPRDPAGNLVARQLLRCGTAGGANYEEARGAESRADFVDKLGVALKEVREALYWLKLVDRAEMVSGEGVRGWIHEADELVAILTASVRTAKAGSV